MSYLISTDPDDVSDDKILSFVRQGVKASSEEILDSIHGYEFIGVQRDKLQVIKTHMDDLNKCISMIDTKLEHYLQKYSRVIHHLVSMVGVSEEAALYILGEIGTNMSVWRDSDSLASWAGLCPGNNESAGKRRSGKTTKGNKLLKTTLVVCAHSAVKVKSSYFYAQFQRISARRGKKRAYVAVAHSMLIAIYHILKDNIPFVDLGSEYYNQFNKERKINVYLKRLKALGWESDTAAVSLPA